MIKGIEFNLSNLRSIKRRTEGARKRPGKKETNFITRALGKYKKHYSIILLGVWNTVYWSYISRSEQLWNNAIDHVYFYPRCCVCWFRGKRANFYANIFKNELPLTFPAKRSLFFYCMCTYSLYTILYTVSNCSRRLPFTRICDFTRANCLLRFCRSWFLFSLLLWILFYPLECEILK